MKQKTFRLLTIVIVCLFAFSAFRHSPFYYQVIGCGVNAAGVTGETLEQATATLQKGKGKSIASTYSIPGTKALTQRFKIGDQCFEVVASTGQPNPIAYMTLYKFTVEKTTRSFTINNDGSNSSGLISFQLTAIDGSPGHFKVFLGPGASLPKGEYAFVDKSTTTDGKISVWAFGID